MQSFCSNSWAFRGGHIVGIMSGALEDWLVEDFDGFKGAEERGFMGWADVGLCIRL